MKPAYPYFGSKALVAPAIWEAFGDVPNYVEPFAGSAAVHLARPHVGKVVTLNELNGFITNFLRAVARAPEEVAGWAAWPVNEIDMHARNAWLIERGDELEQALRGDPVYFDAQAAGWWVWGQSIWIASGWCDSSKHEGRSRLPHLIGPHNARKHGQLPHLQGSDGSGVGYGRGIFATGRREDLVGYFRALSALLDPGRVRFTCGDWARVVTPAVTISHGLTGVLLDPPYLGSTGRAKKLYAKDSLDVAANVRGWAIENGDNPLLRIVLCGKEGEHAMPAGWRVHRWRSNGYDNQDGESSAASSERLWFSPHCLGAGAYAGPLFAIAGGCR